MHLTASVFLDPASHFPTCPQALISRRRLQRLPQLLLLFRGQDRYRTRIAMAPITQGLRTSFVVAMGDGADPSQAIAGVFDDLLGGFALRKQPYDLPVAACYWIFRFAIGILDLFEAQMRFDRQTFLHDISIHQEMV
jgi:hypothetical protein